MILVVHHDPDEAGHLKRALERTGFSVLSAATVQQALNIIRLEPVRAVFIDLRMPEVPCGEVIEWIREVNATVPLFGLADTPSHFEIRMCREKGLKGYFLKPFTSAALAKAAAAVAEGGKPISSWDTPHPKRSGR